MSDESRGNLLPGGPHNLRHGLRSTVAQRVRRALREALVEVADGTVLPPIALAALTENAVRGRAITRRGWDYLEGLIDEDPANLERPAVIEVMRQLRAWALVYLKMVEVAGKAGAASKGLDLQERIAKAREEIAREQAAKRVEGKV